MEKISWTDHVRYEEMLLRVLEKDGEDQLDRSCEKLRNVT